MPMITPLRLEFQGSEDCGLSTMAYCLFRSMTWQNHGSHWNDDDDDRPRAFGAWTVP